MNVSDAGVPVGLAAYEERSIPAEEQNAGRIVDYFYRMEFHITPRFFSDSNYLFFFFFLLPFFFVFFCNTFLQKRKEKRKLREKGEAMIWKTVVQYNLVVVNIGTNSSQIRCVFVNVGFSSSPPWVELFRMATVFFPPLNSSRLWVASLTHVA